MRRVAESAGSDSGLMLHMNLGIWSCALRPNVDEEKAAHRFAAAFLAPAECVRSEVGERRSRISIEELLLLKQRFGMSMQACAYRLKDSERHQRVGFSQFV